MTSKTNKGKASKLDKKIMGKKTAARMAAIAPEVPGVPKKIKARLEYLRGIIQGAPGQLQAVVGVARRAVAKVEGLA